MDLNTFLEITITIWTVLIGLLMTKSPQIWRLLIASHLSPIICYGIFVIYFYLRGQDFNLWTLKEYTSDNFYYFFHSTIFYISLIINIFSFAFFYLIFPALPKFLFKPIYNILYKILRIKSQKEKIKKAWEKRENKRGFWNPINPKEKKIYDKSRDEEFEYDLHIRNRNISLIIQFIFCIMIFFPFKWIFLIAIIFLLGDMIFHRPLLKAIIDNEYKNQI